jgi:hypothetical protein
LGIVRAAIAVCAVAMHWSLTVTQAPAQGENIRRHPNGCIDVDFYRTRAAALRGQAKRDGDVLKAASAVVLAIAGVIAVAILVAVVPAPAPTSQSTLARGLRHSGDWGGLGNERRFAARAHATWEARP